MNLWIYFSQLLPFVRMDFLVNLLAQCLLCWLFCTFCHLRLLRNQLRAGAGCCICFGIVIPQQAHTLSCAIQRNLDPHTARKIYPVVPFDLFHAIPALDLHGSHQDLLIVAVHDIYLAAVAALLRHPPQPNAKSAVFYSQKANVTLFFSIIHIVNIKKLHTKSPPFIMVILMYVHVWDFMRKALSYSSLFQRINILHIIDHHERDLKSQRIIKLSDV